MMMEMAWLLISRRGGWEESHRIWRFLDFFSVGVLVGAGVGWAFFEPLRHREPLRTLRKKWLEVGGWRTEVGGSVGPVGRDPGFAQGFQRRCSYDGQDAGQAAGRAHLSSTGRDGTAEARRPQRAAKGVWVESKRGGAEGAEVFRGAPTCRHPTSLKLRRTRRREV